MDPWAASSIAPHTAPMQSGANASAHPLHIRAICAQRNADDSASSNPLRQHEDVQSVISHSAPRARPIGKESARAPIARGTRGTCAAARLHTKPSARSETGQTT